MCCIFTCCGWMIDLVQRLWTFTMSCCISSAVCCVMLTSSMSGIALGYNYSLAEYIDLKETNVSIYLKRGVFDDEIADDMDWRRSGRMPVAGHLKDDNLRTGAKEGDEQPVRSGRRLDDSVFEADDQNKYEGSLMKLTAKPEVLPSQSPSTATDDVEIGDTFAKYSRGSLDHMKAIQNLIDSRRAMGTSGTTASPLATYNDNNRNFPMYINENLPSGRRMMMAAGPGLKPQDVYAARKAVPNEQVGAFNNWVLPKRPDLFNRDQLPEYDVLSPATYPPPITMNLGPVRTFKTSTLTDIRPISFVTRTTGEEIPDQPTRPRSIDKFDKDSGGMFNEKYLSEGEQPSKSDFKNILRSSGGSKSSEEEYEDEIKGLPVRKRRSIVDKPLAVRSDNFRNLNVTNTDRTKDNLSYITERKNSNGTTVEKINSSNEAITAPPIGLHKEDTASVTKTNHQRNVDNNNNSSSSVPSSESSISTDISDVNRKEEATSDKTPDEEKSKGINTLLDRLITATKAKISSLTQDATQNTNPVSAKKFKIITRKKPFERIIVSSKYMTNKPPKVFDTEQTTLSTRELLDSISISLGEAGLLRKSSGFVKLLQSTLT